MNQTRGQKKRVRKSRRRSLNHTQYKGIDNPKKSRIVHMYLEMLNVVKLYHWKTHSFSQHSATDQLYGRLNEHIDKFVEVMLGKNPSRIQMVERSIHLTDPTTTSDFTKKILEYRGILTDLNIYFDPARDSDLLNIRDEIVGDINQFLYLMTFDK